MAKPKGNGKGDETVQPTATHGMDRVSNILALLLVKGLKQVDAIPLLSRVGYQARDIAALLGTSPNTVSVALYQSKNKGKKAKRRDED